MGKRPTLHEVEIHSFFILFDRFCHSVISTTAFGEQSKGWLCASTYKFGFSITHNECKQIIIIINIILQKHIQCTYIYSTV